MLASCSADVCRDKNSSTSRLGCHGSCGGHFHLKCANLTNSIANKLEVANSGLRWFCLNCRVYQCNNFQPGLDAISFDIDELTRNCENLFQKLRSMKSSISPNIPVSKANTSINTSLNNAAPQLSFIIPWGFGGFLLEITKFHPGGDQTEKKTIGPPHNFIYGSWSFSWRLSTNFFTLASTGQEPPSSKPWQILS